MKHLLVLTSLFALSACAGDSFFDWDYYDEIKESSTNSPGTSAQEESTANPANTSVTQITTDLNNVDFRASDGMLFHFTLDDGVIDGASNGKEWDVTRDGDSNVFVDNDTGDRWDINTYGDGHLKYSDFGIKHKEYDSASYTVFAGGDIEKLRNVYTKSEIEAISNGDSGNKISFVGTAVGVLKNDGKFCTNTRTDAAVLAVTGSTFQLNMPFYTNGNSKFYDVTVNGSYAYTKGEFVNGPDAHTVILSGPQMVEFMDDRPFSETGYINAYGNTTATEAVGTVHLVGETKYGSEAVFDAAFGVTKK